MKGSDYLPLGLLGVLAGFIAYAVATRPVAPTAAAPSIAPRATVPVVTPQGEAMIPPTVQESARTASDAGPSNALVQTSPSGAHAPTRDTALIRALIRDGAPGTYFQEMLAEQDQMVMRWPERRMEPLRVWIERQSALPGWDVKHALAAEGAFQEWQRAGFPLRFDIIPDSANADIQIRWTAAFPEGEREKLGMARKKRDQHGWLRGAEITVVLMDRAGNRLPDATVLGTVRHEIGHALGLGHSPNAADVMFPESHTTAISPADRATLHLLYILPPGSLK